MSRPGPIGICTVALMRHGGSHFIRPIVHEITGGAEIVEPGKKGRPLGEAKGPVIVFLRRPRDRIVATYRWWMRQDGKRARLERAGKTPDARIAWLLEHADGGFLPGMLEWARIWCRWPGALTVRFEDLREKGAEEVTRIANFLAVDCDAEAIFRKVYGNSPTFTGAHSDWQATFGPKATEAWRRNGGAELLRLMGYAGTYGNPPEELARAAAK